MFGFEWARDNDRQMQYDDKTFSNPSSPLRTSREQGFEWTKNSDEQQQYGLRPINKTLILSDGKYMKYENGWQTVSNSLPTLEEFEEHGMEDLDVLNRNVQNVTEQGREMVHKEDLVDGKVFSREASLSKYLDFRGLDIEN